MRIAIVIDFERVLATPKFRSRRLSLTGEKTIFSYDIDEIEDAAGLARLKSFVGNKIVGGLRAVLICHPWIDGDDRLSVMKSSIGRWLDHLATTGISCHQREYDPANSAAPETVLGFIDDFPVKYSKTLEEMMDSTKFLTTTETAAILSEHYREIRPRDVRRLKELPHERSGERRLGYRECDVAEFIKSKT